MGQRLCTQITYTTLDAHNDKLTIYHSTLNRRYDDATGGSQLISLQTRSQVNLLKFRLS